MTEFGRSHSEQTQRRTFRDRVQNVFVAPRDFHVKVWDNGTEWISQVRKDTAESIGEDKLKAAYEFAVEIPMVKGVEHELNAGMHIIHALWNPHLSFKERLKRIGKSTEHYIVGGLHLVRDVTQIINMAEGKNPFAQTAQKTAQKVVFNVASKVAAAA